MLWVKERQRKNYKVLSKKKVIKDLNKDLEANMAPKNYTMKPNLLKYLKPVDKNSKSSQKIKPVHKFSQQPSKVQKILGIKLLKEIKRKWKRSYYSPERNDLQDTMPDLKVRAEPNLERKQGRNAENWNKPLTSRYSLARMDYIMIYSGDYLRNEIASFLRKSERKLYVLLPSNLYSKDAGDSICIY
eukprot:TRINITY_DN5994_c0_g1_i26.p1 TRINITY_DN5994_c0_g1~~TRINITY_DN5994_c0_g1_i26.p1  ORF type:complete len:187 (-),score=46.59 TRINITY_DN5994_c0_g1_i26:1097-1657(-)